MLNILTDVTYRLKSTLFHHLRAGRVGDVLDEGGDEAGPQRPGQLHHGDHLDALGCRAGPEALSTESSQHVLFGGQSDVLRHGQPSLLILRPQGLVVGVQEVLQLDSGLLTANGAVASVVENLRESPGERES